MWCVCGGEGSGGCAILSVHSKKGTCSRLVLHMLVAIDSLFWFVFQLRLAPSPCSLGGVLGTPSSSDNLVHAQAVPKTMRET